MEFFKKANAVRLRSHLDKYLYADEDEKRVRQSRNGTSSKAKWTVEILPGNDEFIRLKNCNGKYLTASEEPFLMGLTGNKVVQSSSSASSFLVDWEPIRDGFQVKLRTRNGNYLRANGSTPPWRNSITHDNPMNKSATKNWVLWEVDVVNLSTVDSSVADYQSQRSSLSSSLSEVGDEHHFYSPAPSFSSSQQNGMELFHNAKVIRLRSHHDKYLLADEDEESVSQDRSGASKSARWTVEFIHGESFIRLKSCCNKYLTASNSHFLMGMTGHKVLQTLPKILDSSLEWEPVRGTSNKVKLKTRNGSYLRANGGVPPWRNSITHDVPHRTATQDWVLWNVDILEIQVQLDQDMPMPPPQPSTPLVQESYPSSGSSSELSSSEPSTPSASSFKSFKASFKLKPSITFAKSLPKAIDGRTIYYTIADDFGNVDNDVEELSFIFKGNGVYELKNKLEEETGMEDIIVCTRSPLNGKIYPLRLQLPPNNASMHLVIVPSSSKG